jgi:hypothetical protein
VISPSSSCSSPARIWVEDFTVEPGAIQQGSGLIAQGEQVVTERPRLLGIQGPLARRAAADQPTAAGVTDLLAASVVDGLNADKLRVSAARLRAGDPRPTSGWIVTGRLVSVDPGNRAARAVVGFGAGEATTEAIVDVDRLDSAPARVLHFGSTSDSGKAPGAVVTMNPYVAAAKFVIGRQATDADVRRMGTAIANEIAAEARARKTGAVAAPGDGR